MPSTVRHLLAAHDRFDAAVRRTSATVAGLTTLGSVLWITLSDRLVELLAADRAALEQAQTIKGLVYVITMGMLLYVGLRALLQLDADRARLELKAAEALVTVDQQRNAQLLASAIAHDVRNNLQVIQMVADDLVQRRVGDDDDREALGDLVQAAQEATALVTRLKDAWRREDPRCTTVDVGGLLERLLPLLRRHPSLRGVQLEVDGPPSGLRISAFPGVLEQAVQNLVLNAGQATGPGGHVRLSWAAIEPAGCALCVDDDGPGVPDSLREQIFEPLYTSRPDGTGLGLLSVALAARVHAGEIEVDRGPMGGARFALRLRGAAEVTDTPG
jgi:signal transduction histidine kinase